MPYNDLVKLVYERGYPCNSISGLSNQVEYAGYIFGYYKENFCVFFQDGTKVSLCIVSRVLSINKPLVHVNCAEGAAELSEAVILSLVQDIIDGKYKTKEVFVESLYFDLHPKGGRALQYLRKLCNNKGLTLHLMEENDEVLNPEWY